jgi:hypothetical protein
LGDPRRSFGHLKATILAYLVVSVLVIVIYIDVIVGLSAVFRKKSL